MAQIENHFTDIFNQWQSPEMIQVVLDLLQEELNYLEGRKVNAAIARQNIPAYHALYQFWQDDKNLNGTQQEWVKQMGGCLKDIAKQTIFGESIKNSDSTAPMERNGIELKPA